MRPSGTSLMTAYRMGSRMQAISTNATNGRSSRAIAVLIRKSYPFSKTPL